MNTWDKLQMFPPVLVRLLARRPNGPPLSDAAIADASGLPLASVQWISRQSAWDDISIGNARAFMSACRMDITSPTVYRRVQVYLRRKPKRPSGYFPYLQRSPDFTAVYLPLITILAQWRDRLCTQTKSRQTA